MNKKSNPKLTGVSKTLRKNMTQQERKLWYLFLKKLPLTVNRQKVIGKYIVDFCCAEKQIVIELDGSGHYTKAGISEDLERDKYLRSMGYSVLRYDNSQINTDFKNVCEDIWNNLFAETNKNTLASP